MTVASSANTQTKTIQTRKDGLDGLNGKAGFSTSPSCIGERAAQIHRCGCGASGLVVEANGMMGGFGSGQGCVLTKSIYICDIIYECNTWCLIQVAR